MHLEKLDFSSFEALVLQSAMLGTEYSTLSNDVLQLLAQLPIADASDAPAQLLQAVALWSVYKQGQLGVVSGDVK